MRQGYLAELTPLLKAKVANVDVAGAGSGAVGVDDLDGGIVVFPNVGGFLLEVSHVNHDHA